VSLHRTEPLYTEVQSTACWLLVTLSLFADEGLRHKMGSNGAESYKDSLHYREKKEGPSAGKLQKQKPMPRAEGSLHALTWEGRSQCQRESAKAEGTLHNGTLEGKRRVSKEECKGRGQLA